MYIDLEDFDCLAKKWNKMTTEQTKIESVFKDLKTVMLEKSTLVIKEITNESWNEETQQQRVFFIEQKDRTKKGLTVTKKDFETLTSCFNEIS